MLDTVVIPCGGLGTRLQPITRWLPKELLPVGLKPVLYWTLDEIADAGLVRVIIVTSPLKPAVEAAARTYPGPLELLFVPQERPRGLGDAFLYARELLEGAPFAAVLPEFLFRGPNPTRAMLDLHRATGLAAAVVGRAAGATSPAASGAGLATIADVGGNWQVTDIAADGTPLENGGQQPARLLGRFVFPGDVFGELERVAREAPAGTEVDGLAVLRGLARRDRLAAALAEAAWYEVGLPEGYRSAVADFPARA